MKRSRFLLELAAQDQTGYVSEGIEVIRNDSVWKNNDEDSIVLASESEQLYEDSGSEYIPPESEDYKFPKRPNILKYNVERSVSPGMRPNQSKINVIENVLLTTIDNKCLPSETKVVNYLKSMRGSEVTENKENFEMPFYEDDDLTPPKSKNLCLLQNADLSENPSGQMILEKLVSKDPYNPEEIVDKAGPSFLNHSTDKTIKSKCYEPEHINIQNQANNALPGTSFNITNYNNNYEYKRKSSARERPTICPICFGDVTTHFTRHLFRHHSNNQQVIQIKNLPPRSIERLSMVSALRKQGYFHLKTEKNLTNPVRTSSNPETEYFACIYCLGHYSKTLLYKHVKVCKQKPIGETNPGKRCLTKSQDFLVSMISKNQDFLKAARLKEEVFTIMRADNISLVAKSDTLICLYGEHLLNKHKRQQISTHISNKMREMGRLLIALKTIDKSIVGLFSAMKPECFQNLITATKEISSYDPVEKCYKAPSLALHMGTNLKIMCNVALKLVIEKKQLPNITWEDRNRKKEEIKDLRKLIQGHWCSEVSSIALKVLNERQWEKPTTLPLSEDIQAFQTYVHSLANAAYNELLDNININVNYKILTECVLALTVAFNRKRIGDVQYLKISTYNRILDITNENAFLESLTTVEKVLSQRFKRVVTGGKGSKCIAILFSPQIQKFITLMLKIREQANVVPTSNPYMFANPGSANRWMAGYHVIRKLAAACGAKRPTLLTSTRFRKHIATTLQLMTMDDSEMEQIATFMGHTKKTHSEFYRLPQNIFQTAKVAKVLMLLEKGKGKEFKGKSLSELEFENDVYISSESNDEEDVSGLTDIAAEPSKLDETGAEQEENDEYQEPCIKKGRIRWSAQEKNIVKLHFKHHIEEKITPKKEECELFISKNNKIFKNKDWVRIKTLVYNTFRLNT
ncbi:unnamed protein product [Diabrotica balteata]|uniref:Uncharacterized protein n=1 Tax=Diabrotica balteata TaxID=107213 RepID=A0A9N9SPS7_DIABA|nr:unnamed protein product [Diabrotica balteata]